MPTIRYTTSMASLEDAVTEGEERRVSAQEAKQAVADGVAVLVTSRAPVTPERAAPGQATGPELRRS